MARSHFLGLAVVSLVLTFTFAHTAWAEGQKSKKPKPSSTPVPLMELWGGTPSTANTVAVGSGCCAVSVRSSEAKSSSKKPTCKVYSLADLGDDPSLCKWVAETIPDVVQPGSWNQEGTGEAKRVLTYHAASKVMVVYHTPEVQTQVEAFLSSLKKAAPCEKQVSTRSGWSCVQHQSLVPAKYVTPNTVKSVEPATLPGAAGYPVPSQRKQPKHLFHFIIRYEGEGIVDDTVSDLLKEVYGKDKEKDDSDSKSKDDKDDSDKKSKDDDESKSGKKTRATTTSSR